MRRTPLPLPPPPLPQMLSWLKLLFFFPFNRKISSQQNEINYLTNRGTKESRGRGQWRGGELTPGVPRVLWQVLRRRAWEGALLLPLGSWGLFSPINCHFQDYQSSGFGAWLWFIAVWQRSLIRSPEHDSKVIRIQSRQNPSRAHNNAQYNMAARARKIAPSHFLYLK